MPPRSRFAALLSVLAAGLVLLSGPGTRLGLWEFSTGFVLLRWGAYLGLAAAGLGLISLLWRGREERRWLPLFALVLGLASALVPWRWMQQARGVPPIHDITTDTERPPEFVAVLPLRADAPNPATYGGPEVALAQRRGYPDLGPLMLDATPAAAFSLALEAAREMDWELVAADSGSGRIEATATTPWFGFKDDVVVRVSSAGSGSRIDVRSVSRVGGSDVGANAERIRAYLAELSSADADTD